MLAAIYGPHYSRPSTIPGSRLTVVTGGNGIVAVVDAAQRVIITVYRARAPRPARAMPGERRKTPQSATR